MVNRLQEDRNGQGAVVPPPDDAAREQFKYPHPAPKPPARPVKRWIKSDRPAHKDEGGTTVGREEEQREELGYGQQQQQEQQQLLQKDGVENRAGDAWERRADGGGFGGEKEDGGAQGGGGEHPGGTMPGARAGAAAAGNDTEAKSLVDAKVMIIV